MSNLSPGEKLSPKTKKIITKNEVIIQQKHHYLYNTFTTETCWWRGKFWTILWFIMGDISMASVMIILTVSIFKYQRQILLLCLLIIFLQTCICLIRQVSGIYWLIFILAVCSANTLYLTFFFYYKSRNE